MTKLKFPKILCKMTAADMDMRSVNPALYRSPKTFNAVGARACGGDILFVRVIDRFVIIAFGCNRLVSRMLVGVNEAVRPHRFFDDWQERVTATVSNDLSYDIAATFQHAKHNSFAPASKCAGFTTADIGFIYLNLLCEAAKRMIAVNFAHILADFMAHTPSGFVRHAKLAFNFLCGNTVPRRAEKEHDKEPVAQGGAGAVKGSASGRVNLMPAIFADIGATGRHAIVMGALAATRAIVTITKAVAHDVFKTTIFRRELILKLAKGGGFRFHVHYVAQSTKCRKGIITIFDAMAAAVPGFWMARLK